MRAYWIALGFAAALAAHLVTVPAFAHGPQIQITNDNGKIVTRQLFKDGPYSMSLTSAKSVYVIPLLPVNFGGQPVARVKPSLSQNFGPGFAYGFDQLDGGARDFTADLNLHVQGLQIWNGASFVATGAEQLGLLQSSSNVNADSVQTNTGGADLAIPISPTYDDEAHSSVRYTLLGDGVSPHAASRDGIYLASLQLSSGQSPSLSPSDPFYFILHKNASAESLGAAIAGMGVAPSLVQVVPEPTSAILVIVGLGSLGFRHNCRLYKR